MKLTLVHKISISASVLVLVTGGVIGLLFYSKTTDLLVAQSVESVSNKVRNIGSILQAHIDEQRTDTRFLGGSPPIQGMLRALASGGYDKAGKSSYDQWRRRLISIFSTMMSSKSQYVKIRFIGVNGRELVAVKRSHNGIVVLDEKELQDKSQRTYFKKTMMLSSGSIFLSEINLNREHGKVSLPHLEVLRSSMPIFFESTEELSGIVVVTTDFGSELHELQQLIYAEGSRIYITNDQGGYLLHPDTFKAYGFDLGKRYRIQEDFPLLAPLFLPDDKEVRRILLPEDTGIPEIINFTKIRFDKSQLNRFVAVGVSESYKAIVDSESAVLNRLIFLSFSFVVGVTFLAVFFAFRFSTPIRQITQVVDDYTHQRKTQAIMPVHKTDEIGTLARSFKAMIQQVQEAHHNLAEMNKTLESRVEERTKALEKNEIFQSSLVENMIDGLITIDEAGEITSYNPAVMLIFGYDKAELLGENIKILMPHPARSDHDSYLMTYKEVGIKKMIGGKEREVLGLHKDGSIFPLAISVSEINIFGEKIFSAVLRDITQRKQMDKMKSEFVSTVSHELRTPLTAIRGSLRLINGGVVGEVPTKVSDLLILASNNTDRLLLLINDILDMQKIESGELDYHLTEMSILPFLDRVVNDNQAYADQYQVTFVLKEKVDVRLVADEHRLMQVMANLLSNAAKFSKIGGVVDIKVHKPNEEILRISVVDYGHGIPKSFQSKLFEKFTQSDSSSTRQIGGTGLGLSISKSIIEHIGGTINFSSVEGEGSTFFIELPVKV